MIDWNNLPVITGGVEYIPFDTSPTPTPTPEPEPVERKMDERIESLDDTNLSTCPIVAMGIPVYVKEKNIADYEAYGITEYGWYVFARIKGKTEKVLVTESTTVQGAAGYIAEAGNNYVDVAVNFAVASVSRIVTIAWDAENTENFAFSAHDLAVRNLDYRATFYVYPVDKYATWAYTPATDEKFVATKYYYTKDAEGNYTLAEVTADDPIPRYYEDKYTLTADTTFATGKTYYTLADGVYTAAEVTAGETVTADTYYEHAYTQTTDEAFVEGKTYYTLADGVYTAAEVTAGEALPTVYYVHSKAIFEGMTRNVTYVCNTPIDCPTEFRLPEIEDETHGCWFEIRFRHTGDFSSTLITPEGVKVATEHTQPEKAGFNDVFLQYDSIAGVKAWRFLNTHSTIPA